MTYGLRSLQFVNSQPAVSKHFRFCDGFTEAAGSVCHNISEGFTRFESGPIVQFFTYALSSLEEIEDYLIECRTRKFIDHGRYQKLHDLTEHTRATTLNFMKSHQAKLPSKPAPSQIRWKKRRHQRS